MANNILLKHQTRQGLINNEVYTGSDCTGSNGSENRVLTLTSVLSSSDKVLVFVNNSFLHLNSDYTISYSTTTTITFLNNLWNDQPISIIYLK